MNKKVDVIIDLQYGSTGKGLIAGYLATHGNYDTVVNANMPNAGHTFIDLKGQVMIHKVLPNGVVGESVKKVMLGPGSIFSLRQLGKEYRQLNEMGYGSFDLFIHENAVVLTDEHKSTEQDSESLRNIGSTQQGTSAAIIQKVMRDEDNNCTAGTVLQGGYWEDSIVDQLGWLSLLHDSENILLEGAQGYSLGTSAGFYPFCTSRDCTPARFLADCGIPAQWLRRVIGTARLHPIRVGGNSGGHYADQKEITWASIGQKEERTTVTNRVRRVFTWSDLQVREAIMACQPDHVFLNFCNYDPELVPKIITKIQNTGSHVAYTGWGPRVDDINGELMSPCDATYSEKLVGNF